MAKASKSGELIDLKELGIENMEEVIDNMDENEKIMEDLQKPWAEKLAEAKAEDAKKMGETLEESKQGSLPFEDILPKIADNESN